MRASRTTATGRAASFETRFALLRMTDDNLTAFQPARGRLHRRCGRCGLSAGRRRPQSRSNARCARVDSSRAMATVTPSSRHSRINSSRVCAAVKSISRMPLASSTSSRGFGVEAFTNFEHIGAEILGVEERQRRLQADDHGDSDGARRACSDWPATRSWYPARARIRSSRARVVLQMPCSSEKRDADGDALFDRQHDDRRCSRHDQEEFADRLAIDPATIWLKRMIRSATNSSTPPSAAFGTCCSSVAPNASSASTIAAANSPDSCERPPVSDTMPVRGGLALTGNAPNRPARMLPAPAPRKSRSTSAGLSRIGRERTRGRRRLHHHDDGDQEAKRQQARPLLGTRSQETTASAALPERSPTTADPLALETGPDHCGCCRDQSDQRAGNFGADGFAIRRRRPARRSRYRPCRCWPRRDAAPTSRCGRASARSARAARARRAFARPGCARRCRRESRP